MLLQKKEIRRALGIIRRYTEIYDRKFPTPVDSIRSVDGLLDVARNEGFRIEVYLSELSHSPHSVRGYFSSKTDESFDIVLLQGQNFCWSRLVLCKELCHVFLDTPECRIVSLDLHVEENTGVVIRDVTPSNSLQNEVLAELAAMEYLLPYKRRVQELVRSDYSSALVAEKYKCPLAMVEKYLHKSNMDELRLL